MEVSQVGIWANEQEAEIQAPSDPCLDQSLNPQLQGKQTDLVLSAC